jgi:hypothetical protein
MSGIARRLRPSPAMVVACLALFVAIGGVGYAAVKLKPNSVKTKNIKNGAVKEAKIANGAVTNSKIADGAVGGSKIANGAIGGAKFFFSTATTLDFGTILAEACDARDVSVPGIQATDHIVVTPPPGFPVTFTLQGIPGSGVVSVAACNTFTAGGVDPDAGGGTYKVLVIR